jgi:hypothetical protein
LSRGRIDAQLRDQGWDVLDINAVRFEYVIHRDDSAGSTHKISDTLVKDNQSPTRSDRQTSLGRIESDRRR